MKLIRVGAYWQKRQLTTYTEIALSRAFSKWKHTNQPSKAPSPATSLRVTAIPIAKPEPKFSDRVEAERS